LNFANAARENAQKGLEMDSEISSPPDLRGHRLNLWYNGLLSYAYLLRAEVSLAQPELLEALTWLENMANDELHGDEYVETLRGDFGGKELIELLHRPGLLAASEGS